MKGPGLCLAEDAACEKLLGIKVAIYKLDSVCALLLIGKEIQTHTASPTHSEKNPSTASLAFSKYIQQCSAWGLGIHRVCCSQASNGWFQGPVVHFDPFDVKTSMQHYRKKCCKALVSSFMSFSPEQWIVQWPGGRHCLLNVNPALSKVGHNGHHNSLLDSQGHHATLFGLVAFWSSITFEWLDKNSDLIKAIAQCAGHEVIVWSELLWEGMRYWERNLETEATTRFLFNTKPPMLTELDWALYTGFTLGPHFVSLRSSPIQQDAETTNLNQANHTSHTTACIGTATQNQTRSPSNPLHFLQQHIYKWSTITLLDLYIK